jgi:hypothetical protein
VWSSESEEKEALVVQVGIAFSLQRRNGYENEKTPERENSLEMLLLSEISVVSVEMAFKGTHRGRRRFLPLLLLFRTPLPAPLLPPTMFAEGAKLSAPPLWLVTHAYERMIPERVITQRCALFGHRRM